VLLLRFNKQLLSKSDMFYVKLLENKSIGVFGFKYFDISQGDAFD
jgi:hypothetical protein